MRSLRARLSLSLVLVIVLLVGLLLGGSQLALRQLVEGFAVGRLEHDLDALIAALTLKEDHLGVDTSRLDPVFQQPYSGHYFLVTSADEHLRSRSLWDNDLPLSPQSGPREHHFQVGPLDQYLLVVTRNLNWRGRSITATIAEDFSSVETGLQRLGLATVVAAMGLLVVLVALQWWIISRGLAPLRRVQTELQRLERGEIPALDTQVPVEIGPLVTELNRLLGNVTRRVERSRHALGNLAHALKTPLTAVGQLGDEVAGLPGQRLRQHTDSIRRLIDRELKRARIAGPIVPGRRVDLTQEATDLQETLARIHQHRQLSLEQDIPAGCPFPGDREDLLELLGNLLDNACQWATHRVRLQARCQDQQLILTVEDDGPGCSADQLARLTERGTRLDESRVGGHGLGLSIVRDIVEQYGGELTFTAGEALGGLRVQVRVPNPGIDDN